ncbi:MAG TPA: hypothetical protein VHX86_08550 [Tepidisphaeraceae bacterium]|jgi:tetratricopeptide (TPR) repeat protein|nr:hypothetical protein [Tepidisphaeraceae bacterium]
MIQAGYYRQIPHDYYVRGEKKDRQNGADICRFLRWKFVFCGLLLGMAGGAWASSFSSATQPLAMDQRVSRLIGELRSDDAAIRQSAGAALTALGADARPAILKLTRSDDPGLRQQAVQILLDLPWYVPGDPPEVKAILLHYGLPDIELRRDMVRRLDDLDDSKGLPALLRLLQEDPSPAVQWTIVTCLREQGNVAPLRDVQPPTGDSRLLAVCGYAQLGTNLSTAINDLRRCANLELANPTDDDGEFDFVIRVLADVACQQKQYDEAADWRRKEFVRGSLPDRAGVPTALLELFALQGVYGPLRGLDNDFKLAGKDLQTPKIQYALSVMYDRANDAPRAAAARHLASAAMSEPDRSDVGDFLEEHGWDDLAEQEYKDFLKTDSGAGAGERRWEAANVHFRLAGLAVKRGDDQDAAEQKEQALMLVGMTEDQLPDATVNGPEKEGVKTAGVARDLAMVDSQGRRWNISATDLWADVYWHYLRAAVARHDEAQTQRRMEQLLELRPTDADIAIDVVPLLEKKNRTIDANLLFQWAFDDMKKKLDADPHNPDNLNGLAWLCAKCNRNLPDARRWAQQAVALMPNNAAILDTLAEVNFRLGHSQEALQIELRAAKLEPDDPFMKQQVERFRAAIGGPATRPN